MKDENVDSKCFDRDRVGFGLDCVGFAGVMLWFADVTATILASEGQEVQHGRP
jgi:hypothetical protein